LPSNAQGIFILKDHLVASGVAGLAKAANTRKIPLVTSDQGTVVEGAGFALGVKERSSGVKGGKLVAEILKGKQPCDLPIAKPDHPSVFINADAIKQEGQSVELITKTAKKLNYEVTLVGSN
jgi:putative ABC transport system substrate-binding protein